mmetsp:Transcript_3655/g.8503  ORF Transcript_3655/g.8503 Transcript_3655/m.8503 type:complete len:263 (+) Transcript_3655:684-1472(+)
MDHTAIGSRIEVRLAGKHILHVLTELLPAPHELHEARDVMRCFEAIVGWRCLSKSKSPGIGLQLMVPFAISSHWPEIFRLIVKDAPEAAAAATERTGQVCLSKGICGEGYTCICQVVVQGQGSTLFTGNELEGIIVAGRVALVQIGLQGHSAQAAPHVRSGRLYRGVFVNCLESPGAVEAAQQALAALDDCVGQRAIPHSPHHGPTLVVRGPVGQPAPLLKSVDPAINNLAEDVGEKEAEHRVVRAVAVPKAFVRDSTPCPD